MSAPIDVPAMACGFTPISSSASITAIWARPRAPPEPSASAKVLLILSPGLPRELPGLGGERPHHLGLGRRMRAGGGAVAHPADDALQGRCEAEELIGEIHRQIRARI